MDPQIPNLEKAKALYDKGYLNEETFKKINDLASKQSFDAEAKSVKTQVSAPSSFGRQGSKDFSDDDIKQEAAQRLTGKINSLVGEAEQKQQSVEVKNQLIKSEGGGTDAMIKEPAAPPMPAAQSGQIAPAAPEPVTAQSPAAPVQNSSLPEDVKLVTDTPNLPQAPAEDKTSLLKKLMPETRGIDIQQAAIAEAAHVGAAKGAEQAAQYERLQQEDQKRIGQMAATQAERERKLGEQLTRLERQSNELNSMKVDTDRYWANKSTGDKIMAGIGLFLGAFGRNGNKAVAVIQDAVDKDIAMQKANIDTKKSAFAARQGIYGDMLAGFKDQRLAEEAARIAYLDNAKMKIAQIESKYQSPELKAKAAELIGALEQKRADAQMAFKEHVLKAMPSILDPNNPMALSNDDRERYVPGFGLALTKEDAKDLKSYNSDAMSAKDGIRQLVSFTKESGKSVSPEMRAQAGVIASALKGSLRTAILGPGAVSDSERALLDEIVANPTKIFSLDSSNKTKLETLMQTIDRNVAAKAKAFGLTTEKQKLGFTPVSTRAGN